MTSLWGRLLFYAAFAALLGLSALSGVQQALERAPPGCVSIDC